VTVRGVKVGTVQAIRLAGNDFVEADLKLSRDVRMPDHPVVIASAQSLFGEWGANIVPRDPLPADPTIRTDLLLAEAAGAGAWPGVTLPDIGQLTAQANRIANDVAGVTRSVTTVLDTTAVRDLRQSVVDLATISKRLVTFADVQSKRLGGVSDEVVVTSHDFSSAAHSLQQTAARLDSLTRGGVLTEISDNARATTTDLRAASADLKAIAKNVKDNQQVVFHTVEAADSLLTRINQGQGSLGRLARDSTLYVETAATLKELHALLADIQLHPKKYFKVSVF
jgi:phospholipid/cholesterol/gamma-HCH transport system substrate-binding protein